MTVIVNGRLQQLRDGVTVADVVLELVDRPDRGVAVALDGAVLPRSEWAATRLSDGQHLEVLRAVQGG
jgi:sulfur carrier protein